MRLQPNNIRRKCRRGSVKCGLHINHQSIVFVEAKHVTPAEVTAALTGFEWEDEYSVKGRNTHVNIFVILTINF